ncbi:MAG: CoA-binding protein, partial [Chloroflexota bacterium]
MLDPFFNPRGIAVIGASSTPGKLGYGVVRNLIDYGYQGPVYPVNPRADEILGRRCYPSVEQAPDPLDLAVIVVPAAAAAGVVAACGRRGIGQAIVVSGGFGETGPEGQAREEALLAAATRYGLRLVGPNCIGIIDSH